MKPREQIETLLPTRKTDGLSRNRTSIPGATYFITFCEKHRLPGLLRPAIVNEIAAALQLQGDKNDFYPIAAVIMPDHVHFMGTLGARLSIGRVLGYLKDLTAPALGSHGCEWQRNGFERRLRPEENKESYVLYQFLNPYRAGLLDLKESWPWWYRFGELRFRFEDIIEQRKEVPSEWLNQPIPESLEKLRKHPPG